MALWQFIYLLIGVYGIAGNWRTIAEDLRRDPGPTIITGFVIAIILIPASMLLAYFVDWVRNLDIPPPP